jgi:hypothetical protein
MIQLPPIESRSTHHTNGDLIAPASSEMYGYVFLTRERKNQNWSLSAFFYVAGDVCLRSGELHFVEHGYIPSRPLSRIASISEWNGFKQTYRNKVK